jgi:hypothetical protein
MRSLVVTHPGYRDWRITLTGDGLAPVEVARATSARRAWAALPKLQHEHGAGRVIDGREDMVRRKADFEARVRP